MHEQLLIVVTTSVGISRFLSSNDVDIPAIMRELLVWIGYKLNSFIAEKSPHQHCLKVKVLIII